MLNALLLLSLFSCTFGQISTEAVAFEDASSACGDGYEPLAVTADNWSYAVQLFNDNMSPAWISSYNVRQFYSQGQFMMCLTFF